MMPKLKRYTTVALHSQTILITSQNVSCPLYSNCQVAYPTVMETSWMTVVIVRYRNSRCKMVVWVLWKMRSRSIKVITTRHTGDTMLPGRLTSIISSSSLMLLKFPSIPENGGDTSRSTAYLSWLVTKNLSGGCG